MSTGDALRWMQHAPAERASLPASATVWTAAEIMHITGIPGLDIGLSAAAITAITYGRMAHRRGDRETVHKHARHVAAAGVLIGGWTTAATVTGPLSGPYHFLTLLWAGGTLGGYLWLRRHEAVVAAREWREKKAWWLSVAHRWGLGGSHLIRHEYTRLGEQFELDTTGTGKRASQIVASGLTEMIAEDKMLPESRIEIRKGRFAGRIKISIKYEDPWARPITHPVLDDDPELRLPVPSTISVPAAVGQDPETGTELAVPLCGETGGKNISVVGIKGAGKTVLLSNISERVTAASDALLIRINLSIKGDGERFMWAPACHLTALGRGQRSRGLAVLRTVNKIIEWRSQQPRITADFQPSPDNPLIVVIIDEVDAATEIPAIREEIENLASKGREYGASLVTAGQRGTAEWQGGGNIRSQQDVFCIGMVNRRGEAMHAAGDLGLSMPDMASYGEGHAGVWVVAELGGEQRIGRTFSLKEPADIARIVAERAHHQADLAPALVEYLGNGYASLLASDVYPRWAADHPADANRSNVPFTVSNSGDAEAGPASMPGTMVALAQMIRDGEIKADDETAEALTGALEIHERQTDSLNRWEKELTDALPPELRATLDRMGARIKEDRRLLAETDAAMADLPDVPAEKLAEHTKARWKQLAEQTKIPDDAREKLMELLAGEGTTISMAAKSLSVKPWPVRRWLERLRYEGKAEVTGEKRGARWRLVQPQPGTEGGDDL